MDRRTLGRIPAKPHIVFPVQEEGVPASGIHHEECLTREGFDGPFSILYHQHRPHDACPVAAAHGFRVPVRANEPPTLLRRHYRALDAGITRDSSTAGATSAATPAAAIDARIPLLFNADITIGIVQPSAPDPVYFSNGDADDLYFVLRGGGTLRSVFGDLRFEANDYVCVPKGTLYRFLPDAGVAQAWLSIECKRGLSIPRAYRNPIGQLRMDAPYSHRDFRGPDFAGPMDEGIRDCIAKREDTFFGFRSARSPLDVVGWDGTVFPFAFSILAFQPRVGQIHLPPSVHGTFESPGAFICSFVPRPLDFHPEANPCPYPHSSVDMDEVLFYANGNFGSRKGIGVGSLSHHPAGVPHGPHPGAYESAPGKTHTEELAVMLDCARPLQRTQDACAIEDAAYHDSFADSFV